MMKKADWHICGSKNNSSPASPASPASPDRRASRYRQGKLSVIVIVLLVAVALVAAAGLYVWQRQNRNETASIAGQWYCISDGMLYTFTEDGQFNARIGEIKILSGSWRSSWRTGYLRFDYLKNDESHRQITRFTFNNKDKELTLEQLDGQLRQMNRQKTD